MSADTEGSAPSGFLGDPRRERLALLLLVLLAFVLRVVYVLQMQASPHFDAPIMDAAYHLEWARALAAGDSFGDGPFFRAPLYPWLLGTLMRVFGDGLLLPRLIQCAFGAISTGLVYLVGREAFERRVGFAAAVLAALNWVLIYFDGELLIPTLAVPLNLFALWRTLRAGSDPTPRNAGLAGLAWGVAAIARPNVLLFMPFLAGWLWLRRSAGRTRLVLALTLGTLAPILPLTAYNAVAGDDCVLISSQAGINFWIGNNPQSDGSTAIVPGTRGGWWEGHRDTVGLAETAQGRELKPSEVSGHYMSKGWGHVLSSAAPAHWLWKLRLFWTDWELGNNQEVRFFSHRYSSLARVLPMPFAWLAGLGLVGLVLALRGPCRSKRFPVWGFVLVYMLSVIAFFVCSRFRVPVLPPLMILAAFAGVRIFDHLRARRVAPFLILSLASAAICWGSGQLPASIKTSDANGFLQLAAHSLQTGELAEAETHLRAALEADAGVAGAHRLLGLIFVQRSDSENAEVEFLAALEQDPADLVSLEQHVRVRFSTGRMFQTEQDIQALVSAAPYNPSVFILLGTLRFSEDRYPEAATAFGEALHLQPGHAETAYSLGLSEHHAGRKPQAIAALEIALEHIDEASPLVRQQTLELLEDLR